MKRFVFAIVTVLLLASTSAAQCANGSCAVDRTPARRVVAAAVRAPVAVVRGLRERKPVRRIVARVATLPGRILFPFRR